MTQKKQGVLFLFLGLFFILLFSGWRFSRARILSFSQGYPKDKEVVEKTEESKPASIQIPSVGINLPVEESAIKNGIWEVSYQGASHLDKSANPGQNGNVVIYGHNKNQLFGPIRWMEAGSTIEITDKGGKKYEYKVVKTIVTTPDDISYVLPKDKETLTLYTCIGFMDSKRFIVIAEP